MVRVVTKQRRMLRGKCELSVEQQSGVQTGRQTSRLIIVQQR